MRWGFRLEGLLQDKLTVLVQVELVGEERVWGRLCSEGGTREEEEN